MKRIFKSLFRRGEANQIKILCLGVGMAIGMVMLAEVIFERSYDNFLPHPENTYQVGERFRYNDGEWNEFGQTSGAIAPGIKRYYPQVEAATRFTWVSEDMTFVTEQKEKLTGNVFLCDSSFFDVFPRKIIVGENPHEGLNRPNNVYISERLYKALGEQIVGKSVSWVLYPELKGKIAGVFEDFPENTHLPRIDMAIAMPTIGQIMWDGSNNWLGNDRYRSYIRLKEGHRIEELKDVKQILLDKVPSDVLKNNPNLENLGLYFTPIMVYSLSLKLKTI